MYIYGKRNITLFRYLFNLLGLMHSSKNSELRNSKHHLFQ